MLDTGLTVNDLLFLGQGALLTLAITAIAVAGGTVLGVAFGVARSQLSPWLLLPLTVLLLHVHSWVAAWHLQCRCPAVVNDAV